MSPEKTLLHELAARYGGEWLICQECDGRSRRTYITLKGGRRKAVFHPLIGYSAIARQLDNIGLWVAKGVDVDDAEIIELTTNEH